MNVYERKDVSYRPADKNEKPQRATLPKKTAFYGTICYESDPLYNNRYMALLEASELLKAGKYAEGTEQYTLSRWFTNDPLRLAVFVHDTVYPDVYNNVLLGMAKRELERNRTFLVDAIQFNDYEKYVTEQFAKPVVPSHDYEYIISATIADMLMHASQLDGVIYPSVPSLGEKLTIIETKRNFLRGKIDNVGEFTGGIILKAFNTNAMTGSCERCRYGIKE